MGLVKSTTDDVGLAVRDALDLLKEFEVSSAHEAPEMVGIDFVDDSDHSNLFLVTENGERFKISISRVD